MIGFVFGLLDCIRWLVICRYVMGVQIKPFQFIRIMYSGVLFAGCYMFQYCLPESAIAYIVYMAGRCMVCFLWLQGPVRQRLVKLVFSNLIDTLCGVLISFLFIAALPGTDVYGDIFIQFLINLFNTVAVFILAYIFQERKNLHELYGQGIISKGTIVLALSDFACCAFVVGGIQLILDEKQAEWVQTMVGAGIVILCIVLLGFSVFYGILLQSKNYYRTQYHYSRRFMEMQHQYYVMQQRRNRELDGFRHDYKKHFYVLQGLAAEGKTEHLEAYLEKLTKQFYSGEGNQFHSGNEIVDIIMQDMYVRCSKAGICFVFQGQVPPAIHISDMDMCTIFSNLMDNAFEACVLVKTSPCIRVQLGENEKSFVIHIENSSHVENTKRNERLVTTKKQSGHGIGMWMLQEAVNQNGGVISWKTSNFVFAADLVLPKNNPSS